MTPQLVDIQVIRDERGDLNVIEAAKLAGFDFKRVYYFSGGDSDLKRGAHAHKQLKQLIVCLRGSVKITLEGDYGRKDYILDKDSQGLRVPAGSWRDLSDFSDDALVMVFASHSYDADDYIRDYDAFKTWLAAGAPANAPIAYVPMDRSVRALEGDFKDALDRVLKKSQFIGGDFVKEFEAAFAAYCGADHAIGCGNGLDALALILEGYGIGAGDEVIVPANSFIATALAVSKLGATPIFVDCDATTYGIDVKAAEKAITSRTKAIIPVHLYGIAADIAPLMVLADKHNLKIIEDAAQAHGTEYKGKRAGALGHAAAFSFYPTKNLGALGDAGAVVTSDAALAAKVRLLGSYGAVKKYFHEVPGWNTRLDPLQAAFLSVKLTHLDEWNTRRRVLAAVYQSMLGGCNQVTLPASLKDSVPVWHVYPVFVADGKRDALQTYLKDKGIDTLVHYPVPIHKQKAYGELGKGYSLPHAEASAASLLSLPHAEASAASLLSLPLDPYHSDDEIKRVAQTVLDFFKG